MRLIKSKKGAYAIAIALIVLLLIIVIITMVPALKQTVLEITGAVTGHGTNSVKP